MSWWGKRVSTLEPVERKRERERARREHILPLVQDEQQFSLSAGRFETHREERLYRSYTRALVSLTSRTADCYPLSILIDKSESVRNSITSHHQSVLLPCLVLHIIIFLMLYTWYCVYCLYRCLNHITFLLLLLLLQSTNKQNIARHYTIDIAMQQHFFFCRVPQSFSRFL